jgi:hypothetical protein
MEALLGTESATAYLRDVNVKKSRNLRIRGKGLFFNFKTADVRHRVSQTPPATLSAIQPTPPTLNH